MDRFAERQTRIGQRRAEVSASYPAVFSRMIAEWIAAGSDDRAWLMYSANYLFRTNNIRWAIDPLTLNWRMNDAPKADVARKLMVVKNKAVILLEY